MTNPAPLTDERPPLRWLVCDWTDEGEIHVVPTDAEHGRGDCWCRPIVLHREVTIYVHYVKQ